MSAPPRQSDLGLTPNRVEEVATPISSSTTPAQTQGLVAALLRENENLSEAQPFGPEGIDYKSKDTFTPFQTPSPDEPENLIDLIVIEGTALQVKLIRAICVKHIMMNLGLNPQRFQPLTLK